MVCLFWVGLLVWGAIDRAETALPRVRRWWVQILNPTIEAAELTGKGIVLDVRARCADGLAA